MGLFNDNTEKQQALKEWAEQWNILRPGSQRATREPLTNEQAKHLEVLYSLIADDLLRLASRPRNRWLGESTNDRVNALYTTLVEGLISRRYALSAHDNLLAYIAAIATHRSIDLLRQERRHLDRQVELGDGDSFPEAVDNDTEEDLTARLYREQVTKAALAYWQTLPFPDRDIMQMRHDSYESQPFEIIAHKLGEGYTADAVRKRYHRTMTRTRQHLAELGLLDTPEEA